MEPIVRTIDSLSRWVGKITAPLIWVIVSVIVYEVVARYLFHRPTLWAGELAQMLFGVYIMLAGAPALLERAHVNMDILYNRFSERKRAIIDITTFALFLFFVGALTWQGAVLWWYSFSTLQHSQTVWGPPTYPYKLFMPVGATLVLLQGLSKLIRDIGTIRGRQTR